MNIREATQKWVDGFNAIPQGLIEKAYKDDMDGIQEITPVKYTCNDCYGEFTEYEENGCPFCGSENINEKYPDGWLPMWGWMWTFSNNLDEYWAYNHLQDTVDCGFRIYESEELGLFFGIDGAGYSFMEEHWIPLYKARGLQWHDEEEETF